MTRDLFIFGTGGHARDLAVVGEALGYRPVFVARDQAAVDGWTRADEVVLEATAIASSGAHFAIGIGDNRGRAEVAARYRDALRFPTLVHPDASVGRRSLQSIERVAGTVIFAGVRLTEDVALGDFVTVNLNATLSHDVDVGAFANISPGANIAGNVELGEGAWIGIGAAINQGDDLRKRRIGAWTAVGSGAVVTRDCDAHSVYAGVPARKIR